MGGAHPRVRGDHVHQGDHVRIVGGLPPRARGSRFESARSRTGERPTPACAGITRARTPRGGSDTAYPRVRGDHWRDGQPRSMARRPTPACAGITRVSSARRRRAGPTPACAGITRERLDAVVGAQAYPRVRGDHGVMRSRHAPGQGLPPRARGSPRPASSVTTLAASAYPRVRGDHLTRVGPRRRSRPTPACAGITSRRRSAPSPSRPTPACAGITAACGRARFSGGLPPRARGSR